MKAQPTMTPEQEADWERLMRAPAPLPHIGDITRRDSLGRPLACACGHMHRLAGRAKYRENQCERCQCRDPRPVEVHA